MTLDPDTTINALYLGGTLASIAFTGLCGTAWYQSHTTGVQRRLIALIASCVGFTYTNRVAKFKQMNPGIQAPSFTTAGWRQSTANLVTECAEAHGVANHPAIKEPRLLDGLIQAEVGRQKAAGRAAAATAPTTKGN